MATLGIYEALTSAGGDFRKLVIDLGDKKIRLAAFRPATNEIGNHLLDIYRKMLAKCNITADSIVYKKEAKI